MYTSSSPVKMRKSTCFHGTRESFQKHMLTHTFRLLSICIPVNTAAKFSSKELTAPVWEDSQIWCKSAQFSAEMQLVRKVEERLPATILADPLCTRLKNCWLAFTDMAKNTGIKQGSFENNTWMQAFLSSAETITACKSHSFYFFLFGNIYIGGKASEY